MTTITHTLSYAFCILERESGVRVRINLCKRISHIHTNVLLYNHVYYNQNVCVCVRRARKNISLLMLVQGYNIASTHNPLPIINNILLCIIFYVHGVEIGRFVWTIYNLLLCRFSPTSLRILFHSHCPSYCTRSGRATSLFLRVAIGSPYITF